MTLSSPPTPIVCAVGAVRGVEVLGGSQMGIETEEFGSCQIVSEILRLLDALDRRDEGEFDYETDITDVRRLIFVSQKSAKLANRKLELMKESNTT